MQRDRRMEKIIVADDEPIECMAINKMLGELSLPLEIIKNAHDGEELVKIARIEKPDIAIIDINMPELNGLTAIEILHSIVPDMKIIIHSAYHDYSYMQRAVQLGVVDYLLKPVTSKDIEKAIERALSLLKQERGIIEKSRKREKSFQQMQDAIENSLMMSVVIGKPDSGEYHIFQESHPEISIDDGYVIAVCEADQDNNIVEYLHKKISAWLERYCVSISCIYHGILFYEVFSPEKEDDSWIVSVINGIWANIKENQNNISLGISKRILSYLDSEAAVREAKISMYMGSRNNPIVYYQEKILDSSSKKIQTRFTISKDSNFNVIFSSKEVCDADIMQLRLFCLDCYFRLSEAGAQEDKWDISELFTDIWTELTDLDTAAKLQEWIVKKQKLIFQNHGINNIYVEKCVIFIERNFNRDISLGDASEYAGVSSFYMTRLLKQEIEKSFVQILTDIRIKKAIYMMRETQLTNAEIGDAVGYSNSVYFNRVFKKMTGMTINMMKQLLNSESTKCEE